MPNALTLEHMSPGLLKVVETCNHEPHRRKSRMREIRSSGSGEGPGRVTSRPTLQALFAPPRPPQHAPPPAPLHPGRWRARPAGRPRPPARPAARRSAAPRDWGWTGGAGGGRIAPQGCPGVTAAGRVARRGRNNAVALKEYLEDQGRSKR